MTRWRHYASVASTDSVVPSSAQLGYVITKPNNTFKMKIQSCMPHMAELDSIRTIVRRV
jgi:hypothetical protein